MLLKSGAWLHYSAPVTDLLNAFWVPFSFWVVHTRTLLPEEWFICCGIPDKFQESRAPLGWQCMICLRTNALTACQAGWTQASEELDFFNMLDFTQPNNFSSHNKRFEQFLEIFDFSWLWQERQHCPQEVLLLKTQEYNHYFNRSVWKISEPTEVPLH